MPLNTLAEIIDDHGDVMASASKVISLAGELGDLVVAVVARYQLDYPGRVLLNELAHGYSIEVRSVE